LKKTNMFPNWPLGNLSSLKPWKPLFKSTTKWRMRVRVDKPQGTWCETCFNPPIWVENWISPCPLKFFFSRIDSPRHYSKWESWVFLAPTQKKNLRGQKG
jgi:hypothetical protein